MVPLAAVNPQDQQGKSWLISGGCTAQGKVPLSDHLPELARLKGNRRYNFHVGLAAGAELAAIATLADMVAFDFPGDDQTIKEVFGIDHTVEDYVQTYRDLQNMCQVIPHICIGLHGGEIRGEYRALELLGQLGVQGMAFIVFTPTRGTAYAHHPPPPLEEVVTVLATARILFPAVPLYLGCMRPGGRYRQQLDEWAVRLGINTIVNPAPQGVEAAKELGLTPLRKEECCIL
jgi:hypothetical protein